MIRFLLGAFMVAHGLLTAFIWVSPAKAVALLLMTLFFNPWLLAGIAINAGIIYAGFQALPQA